MQKSFLTTSQQPHALVCTGSVHETDVLPSTFTSLFTHVTVLVITAQELVPKMLPLDSSRLWPIHKICRMHKSPRALCGYAQQKEWQKYSMNWTDIQLRDFSVREAGKKRLWCCLCAPVLNMEMMSFTMAFHEYSKCHHCSESLRGNRTCI